MQPKPPEKPENPPNRTAEPRVAKTIVLRAVADLIPYAKNPREHSEQQVAQLVASIKEYGFTNPVLVDKAGGIIAGHGRVLAAAQLGMKKVPTIELGYLSDAQRRAYVIADNKLALNATWNEELLAAEIEQLIGSDYSVELTGFSSKEIEAMVAGLGEGGDAEINQEIPHAWAVVVQCENEADQVELLKQLQAQGRKVKGSIA